MSGKVILWSDYADKEITEAQYLAECACIRQAKKEKIKLEKKFWFSPFWKRRFILQLKFANELLKLYPFHIINLTLRLNPWITTLGAKKFLDPKIQEQLELHKRERLKQEVLKSEDKKEPTSLDLPQKLDKVEERPVFVPKSKKSLAEKLRGKKE